MPKAAERRPFQIAQPVLRVFVETTWHHDAIPSNHAGMPEFPAMRVERVFYLPIPVRHLPVAGVTV
jgi:hypothetical protein